MCGKRSTGVKKSRSARKCTADSLLPLLLSLLNFFCITIHFYLTSVSYSYFTQHTVISNVSSCTKAGVWTGIHGHRVHNTAVLRTQRHLIRTLHILTITRQTKHLRISVCKHAAVHNCASTSLQSTANEDCTPVGCRVLCIQCCTRQPCIQSLHCIKTSDDKVIVQQQ